MKQVQWSIMDKLAGVLVVLALVVSGAYLAVPSSLFLRDVSMTVDGDRVRYVRETPFGDVTAEWHAEITLIDGDGFECASGPWQVATYQAIPGNTVTYNLGSWADDCLEAGPPYYLTTTRRVLLFGVIPLRKMTQRTEVEGERPAPTIDDVTIIVVPGEQ
ncbi:hypothetical protein AN189_17705 [Loktanella sp. 3ANDIMAR09]|uniref:hypothetical protein n=1 Tax=Loktanella sp. 3ANDIMAR09 TaxID=1225657 RepID=UPI0006F6FF6D|nr:hypothetical protein [Loktanella sp. 3ANDIMAR09]KQI67058.1 hypothetical protein AN189_17705 [Loktanella sp. 3ANDIMAR09]